MSLLLKRLKKKLRKAESSIYEQRGLLPVSGTKPSKTATFRGEKINANILKKGLALFLE